MNAMSVLIRQARERCSYEEALAMAWTHFCEGPEHMGSTVYENGKLLLARELDLPDDATDDEVGDAGLFRWFPECSMRGHVFRLEHRYRAVCDRCGAVNTGPALALL